MAQLSHPALKLLKEFVEDPDAEYSGADLVRKAQLLSGTVYPILVRFEKTGVATSRWEEGDPKELGRPRRRLYRLTAHGARVAYSALAEVATSVVFRPAEA
jgi:DNA-binding PadR family transcriptional regulator